MGPIEGDAVTYPAPHTRFACEDCTRSQIGLQPGDLTGHSCGRGCTDDEHVDYTIQIAGFGNRTEEERLELVGPDYAERGWRVIEIRRTRGPMAVQTIGGEPWEIHIVADRPTGRPAGQRMR